MRGIIRGARWAIAIPFAVLTALLVTGLVVSSALLVLSNLLGL